MDQTKLHFQTAIYSILHSMLNLIVAFQFVVVGNKLSANVPGNLKGEQRVNTQFADGQN